jgi:hypothetical protein
MAPTWEVFISHASEDKETVARPLARALSEAGVSVWFDEFTLTLGDSLWRSINRGIRDSAYGVVILSPFFFAKEWTQRELDGLASRQESDGKTILPVWHNVSRSDIEIFSPVLADKIAVSTQHGLKKVEQEILRVIRTGTMNEQSEAVQHGRGDESLIPRHLFPQCGHGSKFNPSDTTQFQIENPRNGDVLISPYTAFAGTSPPHSLIWIHRRQEKTGWWNATSAISNSEGQWTSMVRFWEPGTYEVCIAGGTELNGKPTSPLIKVHYRDAGTIAVKSTGSSVSQSTVEISSQLYSSFVEGTQLKRRRLLFSFEEKGPLSEVVSVARSVGRSMSERLASFVQSPQRTVKITISDGGDVTLQPNTCWATYYAFSQGSFRHRDDDEDVSVWTLMSRFPTQLPWRIESHVSSIPKTPFAEPFGPSNEYL